MPERQRRPLPRRDHQVVVARKNNTKRKRALQMLERGAHGLYGPEPALHLMRDQMNNSLGICF